MCEASEGPGSCVCLYVSQHFGFGLCIQLNGGRCIPEQQWRPCFRRSKLYSLMAATRRGNPGVASTLWPLEPRLSSSSTLMCSSSLVSHINRHASPQCVRSRGWEADGAGGRREAGLPSSSRSKLSDPRFHSCNPAKPEAGFLQPTLSPLAKCAKCDLEEIDICCSSENVERDGGVRMNGGSVAAYPLSKPPHDPLTTQPLHIPAKRPTWPTAYPHVSNFG